MWEKEKESVCASIYNQMISRWLGGFDFGIWL